MTNPASKAVKKVRNFRLNPLRVLGVTALLAPLSYAVGRLNVGTELEMLAWGGLGMLLGLPLGLAYGSFKGKSMSTADTSAPNTREMEKSILEQLKVELTENKALFDARKGNSNMYARIEYLTGFWESIKASGRLFVMQDMALLGTVGAAYFWLAQATHLETLAYEAKYASGALSGPTTAQQMVGEARLLDGQLENALDHALSAIDAALAS